MQFIDTHIHLQDFKADCALAVQNNSEARKFVLVAAEKADFAKIATLIRQHPDKMVGAFGIHPWYCREKFPEDELHNYLRAFPQALVGEIGVDALRGSVCPMQHELFSAQLKIALEFGRPVIVHAAKAFGALVQHQDELKRVRFVHHGFVKNRELLKFIIGCGGYIGLGTLFLKQENAAEMWAMMPKDKVLFETDAPFRVDEARYNLLVQENLQRLAEIAGENPEVLAKHLTDNAAAFLHLPRL